MTIGYLKGKKNSFVKMLNVNKQYRSTTIYLSNFKFIWLFRELKEGKNSHGYKCRESHRHWFHYRVVDYTPFRSA